MSEAEEVRPNLTCRCLNLQRPRVEELEDAAFVWEGEEELRFLVEGRGP